MAVPISGEVRVPNCPVAGRVTAGVAGPEQPHIATRIIIGPVRGAGLGLDGRPAGCTNPPGPESGCERGLIRGPHGLLPMRRDPGPLRLKGRSCGSTSTEPARLSLTPGPLEARGDRDRSGLTRRHANAGRPPGSKTPVAHAELENNSSVASVPRVALRPGPCSPGGAITIPIKTHGPHVPN